MDKQTVMKIPETILNTIKHNRDLNYISKINPNDLFNEKNISKEAMDILCYLDYKYWMSNKKKKEVDIIIRNTNIQLELEKKKKYSTDIFKSSNIVSNNSINLPINTKKENKLKKFLKYIKNKLLNNK